MITYRKNREGNWVVFGPQSEVTIGKVQVQKKDGAVKVEYVTSTGKSFDVNGTPHVYGYLEPKPTPESKPASQPRPQRPAGWRPGGYPGCNPGYCDECDGRGAGRWGSSGDFDF